MDLFIKTLAAAVGTVAFSLLFGVPGRYYPFCGLIGGAGWLCLCALEAAGLSATEATFLATVAVILLSRLFAVLERCPSTVFLVSGIFPLVPGAGIYWTAYHLVMNDPAAAMSSGFAALKTAIAIVLGIVFVFEIPNGAFSWMARRKQK